MPGISASLSAYDHLLVELDAELRELQAQQLLRRPVTLETVRGPLARISGQEVVCWCSNDYLGLSSHPALIEAAASATRVWGVGARGARLLAGTSLWHTRLEEALARWFSAQDSVVFPSGYQANLGALGALAGPGDLVVVDRLVHASLVDAARATRARLRVVPHNQPQAVADVLARASRARRRFVITEGVFSMQGDRAPLRELLDVVEAHEAILYLDDAHGAFVLGCTGRGTPQACEVSSARFIYMGTLGKALGCQGGFVVGPAPLIELIRTRARTFLYTTALATPIAAAAAAALELLEREPVHRERFHARVTTLHRQVGLLAHQSAASHIVPVILGSSQRALQAAERLWQRGHWAPAIRPPTVPRQTARLRLSVTALHTEEQIEALARALRAACAE